MAEFVSDGKQVAAKLKGFICATFVSHTFTIPKTFPPASAKTNPVWHADRGSIVAASTKGPLLYYRDPLVHCSACSLLTSLLWAEWREWTLLDVLRGSTSASDSVSAVSITMGVARLLLGDNPGCLRQVQWDICNHNYVASKLWSGWTLSGPIPLCLFCQVLVSYNNACDMCCSCSSIHLQVLNAVILNTSVG